MRNSLIGILAVICLITFVACSDEAPKSRVGTTPPSKKCLKLQDEAEKKDCEKPPIVVEDDDDDDGGDPPAPAPGPAPAPAPSGPGEGFTLDEWRQGVKPATAEDAIAFIKDACADCHDKEKGEQASFWGFDSATYDGKAFGTDTVAPTVYFTLLKKAKGVAAGAPQAMPQHKLKAEKLDKLKATVLWIEKEFPLVVQTGYQKYDKKSADAQKYGLGVILNYKCGAPATRRQFIRRLTNDAFGREPTDDDFGLIEGKLEETVTKKDRSLLADRLFDDAAWTKEFVEVGLKKFADKIASVGEINAFPPLITEDQALDLKQEFYQKVKKEWKTKTWKDIILSDDVMVTAKTAPLYECEAPTDEWGKCTMKAPRGSFFGTIGYLRSLPMSFIIAPYNYGRAAKLHFVISGDDLKNANDGPKGADVEPIGNCLKSKDFRATKTANGYAPFGSLAVPSFGNFCQSCHIARQMAAGSILFRPYNDAGMIYGSTPDLAVDKDANFADAIKFDDTAGIGVQNRPGWTGDGVKIDKAFLESLLAPGDDEKACVPAVEDGGTDTPLASLKDLAKYVIDDGTILASGLARHMPRALSNLPITSEEILVKVNKAYAEGQGKLMPVFKAYFASETYACGAN